MSPKFLDAWHAGIVVDDLPVVPCYPLSFVTSAFDIQHVNLFVLDVEGGELMVLRSIDFARLTFDVIVVEADGHNPSKDQAVVDLLTAHGYRHHGRVVRNDWFVREGFSPSAAPDPLAQPLDVASYSLSVHASQWFHDPSTMARFQQTAANANADADTCTHVCR